MPMIKSKITFNAEHLEIINTVAKNPSFDHTNWGDDDLQDIRVYIRNFYLEQQFASCAYCNCQLSVVNALNAHVEHIVAKSINIRFIFEPMNLCVICADCNTIKRNQEVENFSETVLTKAPLRYPRTSGAFKIVHPHFDDWDDHIENICGIFLHKTNKGKFTIYCCELNRMFRKYGYSDKMVTESMYMQLMSRYMETTDVALKARILDQIVQLRVFGKHK